jgi:hypothetical protein
MRSGPDRHARIHCDGGCDPMDVALDHGLKAEWWAADEDGEHAERPYRLYSAAELDHLPPPEWWVADAIPQRGLVAIIGPKGVRKTFFTLDLVLHICAGAAWHGRAVTQTAIAYLYAEGPFGAKMRVESWCSFHGVPRAELPIWFLPKRLPLNNPAELARFAAEITRLPLRPGIIVVDTLNQNLEGDEDGKGMGSFVAACGRLGELFGCTVIVVHHTPLGSEERGRGHTSFDGAIDTRLIVAKDADRVTAECTHQRNGLDGWTVYAEAVPVGESLVLKASAPNGGKLNGQRRTILEILHREGTLTYSSWLKASELGASSFRKARSWLVEKSYVRQDGKKYVATDAARMVLGHVEHSEGHLV